MKAPMSPEFWFKEVTFTTDVLTLMAMHGYLLLALRHPGCDGETRSMVLRAVREMGEQLVVLGAISPEMLKKTYQDEVRAGSPEFLQEGGMNAEDIVRSVGDSIIKQGLDRAAVSSSLKIVDIEMLKMKAKCCSCGMPMAESGYVNVAQVDRRATWKHPTWDNLLLKPGVERIHRAMAVVCDACIKDRKMPVEVIEIDGGEVRYHKVGELDAAFEITPDMVAENIKDLRGSSVKNVTTPLYWKDETSGKMGHVIKKFLDGKDLKPAELQGIRWYVYQWAFALPAKPETIESVLKMSQDELNKYVHDVLLPMGIDPF